MSTCGALAIVELSCASCEASGGRTLWLRLQPLPAEFRPKEGRPPFLVLISDGGDDDAGRWNIDVAAQCHYDALLTAVIPAYKEQELEAARTVLIQVVCGDQVGPAIPFLYTPNQDAGAYKVNSSHWLPYDKPSAVVLGELAVPQAQSDGGDGDESAGGLRRLRRTLAELWRAQVHALWRFAADSEPKALVHVFANLLAYQDPDEGNTVLHVAARNRQPLAMAALLNAVDECCDPTTKAHIIDTVNVRGQTALHVAVRYGDAECVHYLRRSCAAAHVCDRRSNTVAHYLADTFSEDMYRDVLQPPHMAQGHGIPLHVRNHEGEAAVHIATRRLKAGLVEALLEAGSPHSICDVKAGRTPLHIAVAAGDLPLCTVLLKHAADVNARAHDGSTPLHWAVRSGHEPIVAALLAAPDADANLKSASWPWLHAAGDNNGGPAEAATGDNDETLLSPVDIAVTMADERMQTLLGGGKLDKLRVPEHTPEEPPARPPPPPNRPVAPEPDVLSPQSLRTIGGPGDFDGQRLVGDKSVLDTSVARPHLATAVAGAEGAQSDSEPGPSWLHADELEDGPLPDRLNDDLCCADYVTRVRLAQTLDADGLWRALAGRLGCEHMVEFIAAVDASDSSPTVLLLDQYEQMPGSRLSTVAASLSDMGLADARRVLEPLLQRVNGRASGHDGPPLASSSEQRGGTSEQGEEHEYDEVGSGDGGKGDTVDCDK